MKVTAQDLLALNVIDGIVPEPAGGAHRDPARTARALADALGRELPALEAMAPADLLRQDRKSVVSGKRVSVRVHLGGSRSIKKKHIKTRPTRQNKITQQ